MAGLVKKDTTLHHLKDINVQDSLWTIPKCLHFYYVFIFVTEVKQFIHVERHLLAAKAGYSMTAA